MAEVKVPEWLKEVRTSPRDKSGPVRDERFIDKTLGSIASFMREVFDHDEYAQRRGVLQGIEPRARIVGVFFLIVAAALTARTFMIAGIISTALLIARLSGVSLGPLAKRALPSLIFTAMLVAPVFFSFITPGRGLLELTLYGFSIAVTKEGLETGLFLMARVGGIATLAMLLLLTTKHSDMFKGLRGLPVPAFFVTALFMTFRFILVLLRVAEDSALARKSRTIAGPDLRGSQGWFAARIGFILKKALSTAEEVNIAMASRGFTGRVKTFESRGLRRGDYIWLGFSSFVLFLSFGF